jgi:serine/threonine-protein kinase RsbW
LVTDPPSTRGERIVELDIPARMDYLGIVRQVVSDVAAAAEILDPAQVFDLKVAVSEACTNAMQAHRGLENSDAIAVRFVISADRVVVEIADQGRGFEPASLTQLPPPEHPDRLHHERGLGLPLIRSLADQVEIESSPDGTSVRVTMLVGEREQS